WCIILAPPCTRRGVSSTHRRRWESLNQVRVHSTDSLAARTLLFLDPVRSPASDSLASSQRATSLAEHKRNLLRQTAYHFWKGRPGSSSQRSRPTRSTPSLPRFSRTRCSPPTREV